MKKIFFSFVILVSSVLSINNTGVFAVENDNVKKNQLIENFKAKHPDWTFTEVTAAEVAKIQEESLAKEVARGPAPPVTALYIDQVASGLGTINEYYEDIGLYQLTSHAVKGITGIGVVEIDLDNDTIIDGFYHAVFFDSDVKIASGTSELYKFRSISQNYPWNTMEVFTNIPHQ